MITIEEISIEQIAFLQITKTIKVNQSLPSIIFIHGFTSAKEHNLHYAYYLAEKGFRVLLPDCLYHGSRSEGMDERTLRFQFWNIVTTTIDEIVLLKEYLQKNELVENGRIGLAGTSMGGIITLGALRRYEWIHAAVSLMGSPVYEQLARMQIQYIEKNHGRLPITKEQLEEQIRHIRQYDLSQRPDKLANRPLLFWHGKQDNVVPFAPTFKFYESILPYYEQNEDNLQFIFDELEGHKVTRDGVLKTTEWFDKHL
ncbi:esterase [Rossellomorea sp. BNER]|uniref:esterase n=1 Tax=Rossellomorea sp. BNER TaxID=2962031 RepID=UPI003AF23256|nr:esterase [Rossellomorea sp. BNER]